MRWIGAALLATVCAGLAYAAEPAPEVAAFANAVRSVVVVLDWDQVLKQGQIGSGTLVQHNRVITQCQIVRKVRHLGVKLGGMRAQARLAHEDGNRDLCELEILPPGHFDPPRYQVRSVQEIGVGEPIYAFRSVLDEAGVFIRGTVSAVRTHGKDKTIHMSNRLTPAYGGGPWFDSSGALVGITIFRARRDEDASFAYPAEYVFDPKYLLDSKQTPARQAGQSISPPSRAIEKPAPVPTLETKGEQNPEEKVARAEPEQRGRSASKDVRGTEANRAYLAQIVEASIDRVIYPKEVLEAGWSGTSTIRFSLESGGHLRESFVETTSGYASLDVAALLAVRKAINETVVPDSIKERGFRGVVVIRHLAPRKPPQS
jgi:TonB family protein